MSVRLTDEQIKKRDWLIEQMGDNLTDIDRPIIDSLAFALDRLEYMDERLNTVPSMLSDKVFMSSREKLIKQVNDCYKMLGLTKNQRKAVAEDVDELDGIL